MLNTIRQMHTPAQQAVYVVANSDLPSASFVKILECFVRVFVLLRFFLFISYFMVFLFLFFYFYFSFLEIYELSYICRYFLKIMTLLQIREQFFNL